MKRSSVLKVAALASALLISGAIGYALNPLTGNTGLITVSASTQNNLVITAASLDGANCQIAADGYSFSCASTNLSVGQSEELTTTIENPGASTAFLNSPGLTYSDSGNATSTVLSISAQQNYPYGIGASSSVEFLFNITAIGVGSDSATISFG